MGASHIYTSIRLHTYVPVRKAAISVSPEADGEHPMIELRFACAGEDAGVVEPLIGVLGGVEWMDGWVGGAEDGHTLCLVCCVVA